MEMFDFMWNFKNWKCYLCFNSNYKTIYAVLFSVFLQALLRDSSRDKGLFWRILPPLIILPEIGRK